MLEGLLTASGIDIAHGHESSACTDGVCEVASAFASATDLGKAELAAGSCAQAAFADGGHGGSGSGGSDEGTA